MKRFALILLLAAPQEGPALRVAWGTVRTVDPALAVAPQDTRVADLLFEGLGGAEARIDGPVVTFKLPDRNWSDGRPVKASDYRFAWLRCLRPSTGSPWAFRFRHIRNAEAWHASAALGARLLLYENGDPQAREAVIHEVREKGTKAHAAAIRAALAAEKDEKLRGDLGEALESAERRVELDASSVGIEAVDDRTLRVTLDHPHPGFPALAATTPFRPVPEHVVAAKHANWTHPGNLVTCGAFGVEKWTRAGLVAARVPAGAGVGVGRIEFVAADLVTEGWALYEAGRVDWLDRALVPPDKIEALTAAEEIRAAAGPSVAHLRMNPAMKTGLRRAVALAIDRAPLVKKAGPGSEETRTLAGGGESPARDLAAAMTALVADFPDLKLPRLRLLVWKGSPLEETARAVRDQVEEALAASVRIDLREGPPYHQALAVGDFDLALASFAPEAGDPLGALDLFPEGRKLGEKAILDAALAIPLFREGEWFAAKPYVLAKPGDALNRVDLKK